MKLADLVDLEWLLADPARLPDDVVRAAQAAAAANGVAASAGTAQLDADRALRASWCAAVLTTVRARGGELPGRGVERALQLAGVAVAFVGAIVGGGAALAALAYDGDTPVNVTSFVLVFVVLQLLLFLLLVWFVLRARRGDGPAVPHRLVALLIERRAGRRGRAVLELLRLLRTRHSTYADVERWTLFALVQRFGVAFNVAALVVMLVLVTGTDLVFSWSTTLGLTGEHAHAVTTALSAPWSFWDAGVPSLATVEASQWMRMPGAFVRPATPAELQLHAAAWWRFLAAGLVVYGLLPRVAALLFGAFSARRARHRVGLDHAGFHALYERLLPRRVGFAGPEPASVRGEPPRAVVTPATAHPPSSPGATAVLFVWGSLVRHVDAVRAAIDERLQLDVVATLAVGGADLLADTHALQEIARLTPRRAILAFAAGQQPTADALTFVRDVRRHLGPQRAVVVLLLQLAAGAAATDATPEEHAIWRRSLGGLDDAHLWLETLAGRVST